MAEDNKTLLDSLLGNGSEEKEQSLEELLGMSDPDTLKVDDLAFLVQQAEKGNQDAVYAVGISYMYAENGFPQDELEGVFWLSQSTYKDAPRHVAGYYLKQGDLENMKEWALKADALGSLNAYDLYNDLFKQYWKGENQDLERAEQCFEVLLELDIDDEKKTSVYRLAIGLASEYLKEDDCKKGLEWAKVACGHIDPALEAQMLVGIYGLILLEAEDCDEYIPEAIEFLKKQAEKNENQEAIENLALYYIANPADEDTVAYWAQKAANFGLAEAKNWLAEQEKLYNAPKKVLKKADAEKLLTDLAAHSRTTLEIPREYTEIAKCAFS